MQAHVMRSVWWAYLHWLLGRVTIAFAWVNMFLGIGRYRTWFNLGSWPEAALGLYFGAIILVRDGCCTAHSVSVKCPYAAESLQAAHSILSSACNLASLLTPLCNQCSLKQPAVLDAGTQCYWPA